MVSECYPYTTLIDVAELGYHQDGQRPHYKRKPSKLPAAIGGQNAPPPVLADTEKSGCVDSSVRACGREFSGSAVTSSPRLSQS
jgi:hypothetical protein